MSSLYELPRDLPVPVDDGACAHLEGMTVPAIELESSVGPVDLAEFAAERSVLYVYPRTGRPDWVIPEGWDAIPGARGCTPQSCGFRDHHEQLRELGVKVAGASTQGLVEQIELSERLGILYPVLADPERRLDEALGLPTFQYDGGDALQTGHPRLRGGASDEGLLPGLPARPECGGGGRVARLVTFDEGRVGRVEGEEIVVLDVPTMREWFERGGAAETGERVPLAGARLRPPIVPKKFFHTAGNFREHEEESKQVDWSHKISPWIVFFQNVDALVGQDEPVIYPEHLTEELDYELELAVVIGKPGKWFGPEEAMDYIAGYVIFNDITARDIQRREMESGVFSFCKAIDTFCPLGPWIVTADEIPDPHDLAMELRVNGDVRQTSHSGRMSVTIPEIVSHYSALGYSAGDVLSTGTVSGVAGFSPDAASLYLKPGDVMEAEIEKIGVLRNPVISWQDGHGEPAPPRVRW